MNFIRKMGNMTQHPTNLNQKRLKVKDYNNNIECTNIGKITCMYLVYTTKQFTLFDERQNKAI